MHEWFETRAVIMLACSHVCMHVLHVNAYSGFLVHSYANFGSEPVVEQVGKWCKVLL